ncbi:MAG: L,D-transpeptidase [Syntrophobacteraceae bacterium]
MKRAALWWGIASLLCMIYGCSTTIEPVSSYRAASTDLPRSPVHPITLVAPSEPAKSVKPGETGWTQRAITEDELADLYLNDPQLTPEEVKRILSRLNIRDRYLIGEDIRQNRPMKVPNDFRSYRDWSPLPIWKTELKRWPKSILVVKDLFYLGWYEHGQQIGNTLVCLGVRGQETQTGVFPVLEKDPDHYSRSYKNSYGQAAWMPWALRIYEAVWIHAGDIADKLCSHGCVSVPLEDAEGLFLWSDVGTPVIIVESLEDVQSALKGAR